MENSDLSIEVPYEKKFAGQIYIFESMIRDAKSHISNPGYDFFWIDISMKRCKGALKILQEQPDFDKFKNNVKMAEVIESFEATIKKLESVKEDSACKNS